MSIKKLFILAALTLSLSFGSVATTLAHVTVAPSEARPAAFQTFAVRVPNERSVSTVSVKLVIPGGLQFVSPTVMPGWNIETEAGEATGAGGHVDSAVTSITWSGGEIPDGRRAEFSFSAKTPSQSGELVWKAYQTYADGVVVSWDKTDEEQPKNADGSPDFSTAGPFSVTKVQEDYSESSTGSDSSEGSDNSSNLALYVAVAALVVSLISLALATRPKK